MDEFSEFAKVVRLYGDMFSLLVCAPIGIISLGVYLVRQYWFNEYLKRKRQ